MSKKGRDKCHIHKTCQYKVVLQNCVGTMLPVFRPAPLTVPSEKGGHSLIPNLNLSEWGS